MASLRMPAVAVGVFLAVVIAVLPGLLAGSKEMLAAELAFEFVVLVAAGFAAARMAGRAGVAHGLAVAVGFILVTAAIQGWNELNQATSQGPDAVSPLDLGRLIVTDLVDLSAGLVGGWLSERR